MTIAEVKQAIEAGHKVYWQNEAYEVTINKSNEMYARCKMNGSMSFMESTKGMFVK